MTSMGPNATHGSLSVCTQWKFYAKDSACWLLSSSMYVILQTKTADNLLRATKLLVNKF